MVYYNEFDLKKAAWLRELIKAGAIAKGEVDDRSIELVQPGDLAGFSQCHFFAGIGIWSYALRCAGWTDDAEVWTGSCPCQPFSIAGKGEGTADRRHLWPAWFKLIRQRKPGVVFGEQVSSPDALAWLDIVFDDMESETYTLGAADLCAPGVGAPHIRNRVVFVGHAESDGRRGRPDNEHRRRRECASGQAGEIGGMGHSNETGSQRRSIGGDGGSECAVGAASVAGGMADADGGNSSAERKQRGREHGQQPEDGRITGPVGNSARDDERRDSVPGSHREGIETGGSGGARGPVNGFWRDAVWIPCRPEREGEEGRYRPIEPGTFPLAHGAASRVGRLRGYGDGIVAPLIEEFIRCYVEETLNRLP